MTLFQQITAGFGIENNSLFFNMDATEKLLILTNHQLLQLLLTELYPMAIQSFSGKKNRFHKIF